MFEIIQKLPADKIQSLLTSIREIYRQGAFEKDVSNYAKGRQKMWVHIEAPLMGDVFLRGHFDPELYKTLKAILPNADLFLVHCSTGIKPHRDAPSLSPNAFGIQLKGTATFQYASNRGSGIDQSYDLEAGDVFRFNSKHLHGSTNVSPDRLAINAWEAKPEHKQLIKNLI